MSEVRPEAIIAVVGKMKSEGVSEEGIQRFLEQEGLADPGRLAGLRSFAKQMQQDPSSIQAINQYRKRISAYSGERFSPETQRTIQKMMGGN